MPSTQGNFEVTVNVPAASGGNTFVVNYTITCYPLGTCSPAGAGSFNVVLPSGNNTITIPQSPANLGFVEPSCSRVSITGTIRCQTSVTGTQFTLSTDLNQRCKNYVIECINPNGCPGFNTDSICPTCTEIVNTPCVLDQDQYWSGYQPFSGSSAPTADNKIPFGSKFNLCYSSLTKINQELGIGTPSPSWSVTLNDFLEPTPLNPDDPCCWKCERRTFTFAQDILVLNTITTNPKYLPGSGQNGKYPSIHYTSCDEECTDVSPAISCFATKTFVYNDPALNGVTLCLRKGSYTILNALVGTNVTVSGPVTGPCAIPDQYIP